MKTIEVSKAQGAFASFVRSATDEPLIVTERGKPLAALVSVEGADMETLALSNNPTFIAIIEESRRSLREEGAIPHEEIRRRFGLDGKTSKKLKDTPRRSRANKSKK